MKADHQLINSSKSVEWYTPKKYVDAAREVLERIDLDPASCAEANLVIRANQFYTKEQDGLSFPWYDRVFLNPPYGKDRGKSLQGIWIQKLLEEYRSGRCDEAILLVNASTSEKWFQQLWDYPICFTDHRIRFDGPDGKNSPTKGNCFVYFGPEAKVFTEIFSRFGRIVLAAKPDAKGE